MSTENITKEIFGARLSETMEAQGVTQTVLGEAVGIAQSAISNYCNGKRLPPMEESLKIANYLKVDVQWLLAWKETSSLLKETFKQAGIAADAREDISEEERQRLFNVFVTEPIALELEGIRINAEHLARRIVELQRRLFPKSKTGYKTKPASSKAKKDAAEIALEVSEQLSGKKPSS